MTAELRLLISGQETASGIFGRVRAEASQLEQSFSKAAGSSTLLKQGVTAAAGSMAGFVVAQAITQLPGLLASAGKAAADDAASIARLNQALSNAGASAFGKELEETAQKAARFGVADDQARESLALLVAQTGSAAEAQSRFGIALDLSKGAGIDLATSAKLVGKVSEENTNVLARYGIVIKQGATETEALAAIQAKFGGQADAFANSSAGGYARFNVALEEAKESLGRLLQPLLTGGMQVAAGTLKFLEMVVTGLGREFDAAKGAVSDLWDALERGAATAINPVIDAVNLLIKAWNAIPFHDDIAPIGHLGDEAAATGDKARQGAEGLEAGAAGADQYGKSAAAAAASNAVLNKELEAMVNGLGLSRMGFEASSAGVARYQESIAALAESFGDLSSEEQRYLVGASASSTTYAAGSGPLMAPVAGSRAEGGPVNAGELYRVNERGMEYFRPNSGGEVIPIGGGGAAADSQRRFYNYGTIVLQKPNDSRDGDSDFLLRGL